MPRKIQLDHEVQIKTIRFVIIFSIICVSLKFNIKNRELKFIKTILTKIKTNEMYKYHSIRIMSFTLLYSVQDFARFKISV